jgi:hypothetical protein
MPADTLTRTPVRLRNGREQLREDISQLQAGILDVASFRRGWRKTIDPVEVRTSSLVNDDERVSPIRLVRDPKLFTDPIMVKGTWRDREFGMRRRVLREVRRQHNQQLNIGVNQLQRIQAFGDIGTNLNGSVWTCHASTAPTSTTWTTNGTSLPTATSGAGNSGLQGHLIYVANAITSSAFTNPVVGVCVSNTNAAVTVDQWYAVPITGAAGTTPSLGSAMIVLPGSSPAAWIGLSTDSTTPAATDVTRTADGLWANGTSGATATEQTANGLARAYAGPGNSGTAPSFPATLEYELQHTWTYTGSGGVTIAKVVLFNSLAAAGTIPVLDTLLNATATVSSNGDTIAVSWTITL